MGPQLKQQLDQEQTAQRQGQDLERLPRGVHPGLVLAAELARDERDADVGQDAGHVEHDERQHEPVLEFGRERPLHPLPAPPVPRQTQLPAVWELD